MLESLEGVRGREWACCLTDGSQRLPGVVVSGVIFPEKMPAAEGLRIVVVSRGRLGPFSLSLSIWT
jgi:hypothetical protein